MGKIQVICNHFQTFVYTYILWLICFSRIPRIISLLNGSDEEGSSFSSERSDGDSEKFSCYPDVEDRFVALLWS